MSEPRIYRRNHVGADCSFYAPGFSNLNFLYDRNVYYPTYSTGYNSDTMNMNIEITFPSTKYVDKIIVLGHNLKDDFQSIYYWDGAYWIVPTGIQRAVNRQSASLAHTTLFFNGVNTTKILLQVQYTNVANQEKVIGEIIACSEGEIAYITTDMSSYSPRYRQKTKEIPLGDGSLAIANSVSSNGNLIKYECTAQFKHLQEYELEYFKSIKNEGGTFLWHPESSSRPQDIFLVTWTGSFAPRYTSSYKGAGWTLDVNFKEV